MKSLYALPLLLACGAALADDAALLHCRALSDASARLACYDAIPAASSVAASVAPAAAVAAAPAVASAAVPAAAAAAAPAPTPEQSFGMATVKRAEPEAPKFIESTIPGTFQGWGPTTQFTLANGQVWRVVDGSSADLMPVQDAKVRIVRNLFGTMFLEIPGTNNSPKVRRVR